MTPDRHDVDRHEVVNVRKRRADVMGRVAVVLVVLFVASSWAMTTMLTFQARQQAEVNGRLNAEVMEMQALLVDCVTPGGDCYEDGQETAAGAVRGVNEGTMIIITAALTCQGRGVEPKPRPLMRCIQRVLDKSGPMR